MIWVLLAVALVIASAWIGIQLSHPDATQTRLMLDHPWLSLATVGLAIGFATYKSAR